MHILVLNWRDIKHPLSGGAEISLFEHAKYWKKKGAKITWLASSFLGAKKKEEVEGITILRAGSHYSVHIFGFLYYLFGKLEKPDIVIDSFHFLPFFTPIYMKQAKIAALINEVAGRVWFSNIFFPMSLIGFLIEPFFFRIYKNQQFITSSESTKKELVKLGIKKIEIVPHGLTIEKISNAIVKEQKPTLIFLGRISKDKGIEDALEALIVAVKKIHNLQMWIVGKEEKKGDLKKLLTNKKFSNLTQRIKYFNYVSENKKFELLKRAWVLVHPSKKEGWGLTVIEAASQGTPSVGYDIEGLRDSILHGKTGLLVSPNPQSLVNAVIEIVTNRTLYNKLSMQALNWANGFSWEKSNRESWEAIKV